MAEIVNLRQARKAKVREAAAAAADANRLKHGRTKAEKAGQKAESNRSEKQLDQARLNPPPRKP